jgi:hypothetical protein
VERRRRGELDDPAACLGTELQDDNVQLDPQRRTAEDLERYMIRYPSGFGNAVLWQAVPASPRRLIVRLSRTG